jgi:hypothetical protein
MTDYDPGNLSWQRPHGASSEFVMLNGKNSYHQQGDGDFFRYALQIHILHPARTPN